MVAELEQRAPKWTRQPVLTSYLLKHKNRMFPAIVVVVSENWVNNLDAPEWGEDKRAKKTSMPFEALDSKGAVRLLDLEIKVSTHHL